MPEISCNANLQTLNTMRLPVTADYYLHATDLETIKQGLAWAAEKQCPFFILGGGSNTLFSEHYPGLVLHIANAGIKLVDENNTTALLRIAAGENWDGFLQYCLQHGFYGLENLAIIPGTVGAAPIQNIGAYGQEVADCIHTVHVIDVQSGKALELAREQCRFAYRDSLFKQQGNRYLVTAVDLVLQKQFTPNLAYRPLADAMQGRKITAENIRRAVISLRTGKLPDPSQVANCGSFFKNPVISAGRYAAIQRDHADAPGFTLPGGDIKLPAAWLIEQCGWRGKRLGPVGMYEKQALVLVNYDHARYQDVMTLADTIRRDVEQTFAITLEIEPVQVHV